MVKPFYIDTSGAWVLGHNQKYSAGSQLQAGARAELIPSDITTALSTFGGRIAARTMQYMYRGNVTALLNYAAFRPYAIMEAIKYALGDDNQGKVVLNPVAGYSPVLYWLAQQYPDVSFIEMDIAKTIDFKRKALEPFKIPKNLEFQEVDLSKSYLHEELDRNVDVMLISGAYVSQSDFRDMLRYIKNILTDHAVLVAPFPDKSSIENFHENSAVFSRIVTHPRGALANTDEPGTVFKGMDFTIRKVIKLSELAKKYEKPVPADIEMIVIAKRGIEIENLLAEETQEIMADIDETRTTQAAHVPPFIDFDMDSFKNFPRRYRRRPPEPKA